MTGRLDRDCPRCGHLAAELISLYGSQLMTSLFRCRDCGELFEAIRSKDGPQSETEAKRPL